MPRISNYFQPTDTGSFGPEILEVVGNAYDMTIATLHRIGQPEIPREAIAKRIIKAAREGERDPVVLSAIALGAVNSDTLC
jgi:hypothetical protein